MGSMSKKRKQSIKNISAETHNNSVRIKHVDRILDHSIWSTELEQTKKIKKKRRKKCTKKGISINAGTAIGTNCDPSVNLGVVNTAVGRINVERLLLTSVMINFKKIMEKWRSETDKDLIFELLRPTIHSLIIMDKEINIFFKKHYRGNKEKECNARARLFNEGDIMLNGFVKELNLKYNPDAQANMRRFNIQESLDKGEEIFNQIYKKELGDKILSPHIQCLLIPLIRTVLGRSLQGYDLNQGEILDLIDERLIKMGFIIDPDYIRIQEEYTENLLIKSEYYNPSLLNRIKTKLKQWFSYE